MRQTELLSLHKITHLSKIDSIFECLSKLLIKSNKMQ
jgi:hypothetical protein